MTQSTGYGPQWPTPKRPKRWPWIVGIAAAFVFGLAIGNAGEGSSVPVAQSSPTTSAPRATYTAPTYSPPVTVAPVAPVAPDGSITNGTYEVGVDIAPGKYKTTGPADTRYWPMCYWARLKDTTGDFGTIIANDNIKGQTTITIKDSDGAFETNGCAPWVKID